MTQDFELMENLVKQADEATQRGRYDQSIQIYQQSLGYLKKHMNRLSPTDREPFLQVEVAIREEQKLVEELQKGLKDLKQSWMSARDMKDDFDFDKQDYQRQRTPQHRQEKIDKPWKPTPNAQPARQAAPPARDNQQQKEKPFAQKPGTVPKKKEDEFPSSYEGVDQQCVSQVHGMMIKKPDVRFADVAGLENAKRLLEEAIILPTRLPEFFSGQRKPWKGVLLFGPPGTGKTFIAKAVAAEAGCTFFAMSASSVMDKWLGSTERAINAVFKIARFHAPSIIFIDEIDAIMSKESGSEHEASKRVRQEILTQMDGVGSSDDLSKHVVVLAATNHPYSLDEALRRRLEKRIYLPLPDLEARAQILQIMMREEKASDDVDLVQFNLKLDGYSASDIKGILKDACMCPLRRLLLKYGHQELQNNKEKYLSELFITMEDLEQSLAKIRPSSNKQDLESYLKFEKEFAAQ